MSERIISERRVSGVSTSCDHLCSKYIIAERNQRNNRIIAKTLVGCLLFSWFFLLFLVYLFENSCYLHIIFPYEHIKRRATIFSQCVSIPVFQFVDAEKESTICTLSHYLFTVKTYFFGPFLRILCVHILMIF